MERRSDGITITVPKLPWYRRRWVPVVAVIAVVQTGGFVAAGVKTGQWSPVIAFAGIALLTAMVMGAVQSVGTHMPGAKGRDYAARFEVTGGDTLSVWYRPVAPPEGGRTGEMSHFTCQRHEIISLRGDCWGMGLLVRVRMRFMAEILHERPKVLRVWIAKALCEALGIEHRSSWKRGE